MQSLLWRIRVAALWVIAAVSTSAAMILFLAEPGSIADVMEGRVDDEEITSGMLILMSLFWLVPLAMAFLTLVLRDRVNRWTTAGMGLFLTLMWSVDLITHLVNGDEFSGEPLVVIAVVVTGLGILWHVWKWPEVMDVVPLEKPPADQVTPRMPVGTGSTRR